MALIFYSSRYGYDEPSHEEPRHDRMTDGTRPAGAALKTRACLSSFASV